jgi:hypothetical protein
VWKLLTKVESEREFNLTLDPQLASFICLANRKGRNTSKVFNECGKYDVDRDRAQNTDYGS